MGTLSRHSTVFFSGTIFSAALGYLFKVYLARSLDARALGIYALGMTLVAFLSLFNSLGLPRSASRYVAAYCATEKFDLLRGFLARSLLALLAVNVLLGVVMLLVGPGSRSTFITRRRFRITFPCLLFLWSPEC